MDAVNHPSAIILASQSRARQTLLRNAGIDFVALAAEIDERAVEAASGLSAPEQVAELLAREKALHVARQQPGRIVIGADQTLARGARRFSKPADRDAAAAQLRALAGHTHHLNSAVVVAQGEEVLFAHVAVARMTMRPLSDDDIARYLDRAGAKVTASVGAYQLEGLGVHLFDAIEGDYFTILGLPLLPLLGFLRAIGRAPF